MSIGIGTAVMRLHSSENRYKAIKVLGLFYHPSKVSPLDIDENRVIANSLISSNVCVTGFSGYVLAY